MVDHYGRSVTPIPTALGVGGLAVALALQDTLSNLFGGFSVAIARQIRLGDYIKLNTGKEGYVTDIGWRSTIIAGRHNLSSCPTPNWRRPSSPTSRLPDKRLTASLEMRVSYDSDPDQVERSCWRLLTGGRGSPGHAGRTGPVVTLDPGFGDSAVSYTLSFKVADFAASSVYGTNFEAYLARFRQEGVQMPSPPGRCGSRDGRRPEEQPSRFFWQTFCFRACHSCHPFVIVDEVSR